jgi:hypothetical protein
MTKKVNAVRAYIVETPDDGSFWAETYVGLVTILFTYIYVQYVGYIKLYLLEVSKNI